MNSLCHKVLNSAERELGPLGSPELVFGAATFSYHYNTDEFLTSDIPFRTVRLALRYGINVFDTAPYYGNSEIVLGTVLKALQPEFPRTSYKLITKCGRYSPGQDGFDYSPATIRTGILRSLARLHTGYLDAVYLHDVEFVCTKVASKSTGNHATALKEDKAAYGLLEGEEGKIWGEGDQKILDAIGELRKLKQEGLIRNIGISGFPLPTLLRLALLVLHTPPYEPLDIILSYSHLCLQNATYSEFIPHFRDRAQIRNVLTASPLSMGLLTPSPPIWHPAPEPLRGAIEEANKQCAEWDGGLVNIAVGYALRRAKDVPTVVGFSKPREVHENVRVWREVQDDVEGHRRKELENKCVGIFRTAGYLDWDWATA
ncbi:Aldo/keto reductase [Gloeophyllum trabeum ATCC 11539]|uniref:Aldo/keto reductase n=1 Tax=Gloeophyllum trabeum (strain ATCC 11539 / FP-39264 / Madison 617) TaxID=670483 RepID=S7QIR2_GLOTA|nr:Aldo/keto reductase [Gloeophyllum trabeum ATCC 11539]EPQ59501.1 Aldo/keto reductase [Gloeophyllum trabeum ATCC 11539]